VTPEAIGELTIERLLNGWPQTAEVFQRHHTACIGCTMALFCRVFDAIDTYHLSPQPFLAELKAIIDSESNTSEVVTNE
jgi:hypothetical protein